ncbi:hypothetical protein [Sphingomonas panacis]|uniref:hypothetical protein n=1 Tax=Sphingomonas panacis TaxID=1560345 RepID=UPI001237730A|nr:hypothetical protein [Sphingomonas panacis]
MPESSVARFCIRQDGTLFEIFAMRETSDDTVIISMTPEDNFEGWTNTIGGDPIFMEVGKEDESRFSLHPSIGRTGLSFTTNQRINGKKFTGKLLLDATVDDFATYLYSCVCPIMNVSGKIVDEDDISIKEIGAMQSSDFTSLVYSISVTSKNYDLPNSPSLTFFLHETKYFKIWISVSYLNVSFGLFGGGMTVQTFSPQVDKIPLGDINMKMSRTLKPEEIPETVIDFSQRLSAHLAIKYAEAHPEAAGILSIPLWFHPTIDDLHLGRRERGY